MSFGPTAQTKQAENNLGSISNTATGTVLPAVMSTGSNAIQTGNANTAAGTNFFNTILSGDRANTSALLAPTISDTIANNAQTLKAINTLMPRGGGRFSSLFANSLQPQSTITGLFNNARVAGAQALPQIGLAQSGQGVNLFGQAPGILNSGTSASGQLGNLAQAQQQMGLNFWGGLGSGLFGLATTPFGGANKSILQRV